MNQLQTRSSRFAPFLFIAGLVFNAVFNGVVLGQEAAPWESSNPIVPIPDPPLGIGTKKDQPAKLTDFPDPPTPERVRLGRWLFFDKRVSADNKIACATCYHLDGPFWPDPILVTHIVFG